MEFYSDKIIKQILGVALGMLIAVILPVNARSQTKGIATENIIFSLIFQLNDSNATKTMIDHALDIREKEPDSAIALFNYSLVASQQLNYADGIITSLDALGIMYAFKGKEQEAVRCFLLAIKAAEKEGPTYASVLCRIYGNLGNFFLRMDQYEKAIPYLEKSKNLAESIGNYRSAASTLVNFGDMYIRRNKPDSAESYFKKALELSRRYDYKKIETLSLLNLANLRLTQSRIDSALDYLSRAESIKDEYKDRILFMNYASYLRGIAYLKQKDYKSAERYLTATLNNYQEQSGDYLSLLTVYQSLAAVYAADHRFAKAYEHQQIYITLKDSLQREQSLKDINRLETQYQTEKKDRQIAEQKLLNNHQVAKIKQKNLWIWTIFVCSVLFATLTILLLIAFKRRRNLQKKEIQLIQQDQKIIQLHAIMQSEEKERNRIGRDLHDSIGGMVAAIHMNLKTAIKRNKGITDMNDFKEVQTMLQDTAKEIRKMAHNLIPDVLKDNSLQEALSLYCNQINRTGEISIELYCHDIPDTINTNLTVQLYRIIQELVQNILKHAKATKATLQIRHLTGILSVNVEDNGTGFKKDDYHTGRGIKNILSRIESMEGYISIDSSIDNGTTVYIELDLKKTQNNVMI